MLRSTLLIIILLGCFIESEGWEFPGSSSITIPKNYWLVYTTSIYSTKDNRYNRETHLLQFNSAGVIVKPSTQIPRPGGFYSYPIAITDKPFPALTIWSLDNSRDLLRKLVISQTNYELQALKLLKRTSSFAFTNRVANNFMLYPGLYGSILRGVAINSQGGFTGENWLIYEKSDFRIAEPADCDVSEDGGAVVFQTGSRLEYMQLREDGRPKRRIPTRVSEGSAQIQRPSITDRLIDNSRLVAYEKYYGRSCNSGAYGYLMVRKVNAETGKPIGPEQFIRLMGSCEESAVRIDPKGKFILYHAYDYKKAKFEIQEPILFQFLNEEGRKVGRPIPFAEGIDGFFDLVSD